MRKYIHPYLKETIIQAKDGSTYIKNWLYFRKFLPLEIDFSMNKLWQKAREKESKKKELKKRE